MVEVQDVIICLYDKCMIIEGMYDSVVGWFLEMVYDVDLVMGEELECINEQEIFWKEWFSGGSEFLCKVKFDCIFFNYVVKMVWIRDLKFISFIVEFNWLVEKYYYYWQKVWYMWVFCKWLFQCFGEIVKQWCIKDMSFIFMFSLYFYISQEVCLLLMYD